MSRGRVHDTKLDLHLKYIKGLPSVECGGLLLCVARWLDLEQVFALSFLRVIFVQY